MHAIRGRCGTRRTSSPALERIAAKDDESSVVPVMAPLAPVVAAYKLKSGGEGLLFRAGWHGLRGGTAERAPTFVRPHTLHAHLAKALETIRKEDAKAKRERALPELTWYQCTRHTFARSALR